MKNYLEARNPLVSVEQDYVSDNRLDDLVAVAPDEKDSVYRFLQSHERLLGIKFSPLTFSLEILIYK